jgi:hypothetical protein
VFEPSTHHSVASIDSNLLELQILTNVAQRLLCLRFDVFKAATMKNDVFLMIGHVALVITDISPHHQGDKTRPARKTVTAIVLPSSKILVTLMMEAISSSETLVLPRAKRRNIPENGILHYHAWPFQL